MTLRVLTFNIWHDDGDYAARAPVLRAAIEQLAPDVIGFQEVLTRPDWNQASELLSGLGYHVDAEPSMTFWGDDSYGFGNAVASRWPIAERAVLVLPAATTPTRNALSVTIDSPHGPLSVTSTHLNHMPDHGFVRCRQVVALADFVAQHGPSDGFPPVVCGDFNSEPDSDEIRFLTGKHVLDGRNAWFQDAWTMAGDGGPGHTFVERDREAPSLMWHDRRIDYVFVGRAGRDGVGLVERCALVGADAVDGVWPSDHAGVFAEVRTEPVGR